MSDLFMFGTRFVRRDVFTDSGGREFVCNVTASSLRLESQLRAVGSPLRFPAYAATDSLWWDTEMNDLCSTDEAATRVLRPVPDRFARLGPTETKPSAAKEGPRLPPPR